MTVVMDDSISLLNAELIAQESEGVDYGPSFTLAYLDSIQNAVRARRPILAVLTLLINTKFNA